MELITLNSTQIHMSKTIIFDTEATGIKEPVLIEAAWVELESIEHFTVTNPFVQRYNPAIENGFTALIFHANSMLDLILLGSRLIFPIQAVESF